MTALLRYQLALLLRSHRWLPPLLVYLAVLGAGVGAGRPVLDSLGLAAAALVPVTAWFVRVCVTQEPPAARAVTAAARGTARTHAASLLAALTVSAGLGLPGTAVVAAISAPSGAGLTGHVSRVAAAPAGLVAACVCLLVGLAVGALCNRPVLAARGWSILLTLLVAVLTLVVAGSPAKDAVTDLVTGSLSGSVRVPALPLAAAVPVAAAAVAVAVRVGARRS
ncbi:ABC transporter [Streptomyces sp. 8L]|uniref:ABC transporter n=1 Tax=Streptomyces sp. 8L TaxID=2877242 RepID=UPI001CD5A6F0|nr:ABC transporter [Streptomyces sp. 8L]MCA1218172.1 ABC transporter [Streptomyces sp. 8L]